MGATSSVESAAPTASVAEPDFGRGRSSTLAAPFAVTSPADSLQSYALGIFIADPTAAVTAAAATAYAWISRS